MQNILFPPGGKAQNKQKKASISSILLDAEKQMLYIHFYVPVQQHAYTQLLHLKFIQITQ